MNKEFESVIDGKKVKLKLLDENLDIERRADTEYHIAYTQLMKRGVLPRATLEKQMRELEIWSDEDETQLNELQTQLADLQLKLNRAETHDEGLAIAKEMGELRADCLKLIEAKAAVLSNSCEELAGHIRRDAYIAFGTVYADTNKRVFKDYHDLIERATEQVVLDARQHLFEIMGNTFQESLSGLPEIEYVRKVEADLDQESEPKRKVRKKAKKKTKKRATRKRVKQG